MVSSVDQRIASLDIQTRYALYILQALYISIFTVSKLADGHCCVLAVPTCRSVQRITVSFSA